MLASYRRHERHTGGNRAGQLTDRVALHIFMLERTQRDRGGIGCHGGHHCFFELAGFGESSVETTLLTWLCFIHGDERVSLGVQTMGFLFGRCLVFLLGRRALLRLVRLFGVFRTNAEAARLSALVLIVLKTAGRLGLLLLVLGGVMLLTRLCSHDGGGMGTARVLKAGLRWRCLAGHGGTTPAKSPGGCRARVDQAIE